MYRTAQLLAVLVMAGCGAVPGTAGPDASSTRTASPPAAPTPPAVIASCPATVSNSLGSYSFQCTTNWRFINCQEMVGAFTWLVNPGNCSGEQYGSTMLIESEAGDHSADPENGSTISVGLRQSSQPVLVSGASGTRRTYLY